MKFIPMLRPVAALALVLLFGAAAVSAETPGGETVSQQRRAIFAEGFTWVTREGADEMIAKVKRAGFNAIVVCVWHGRGTSWPSELAPAEPRWQQVRRRNPDPLRYLVEQAHAHDIEIHAWFTVMLRQRDFFPEFYDGIGVLGSIIDKSFNVHRAPFRDFIVGVIDEFVGRYAVDGVNLDFIRSMGVCTSRFCVQDYREKTGRDLLRDVDDVYRSREALNAITAWNAASVTEIVERVAANSRRQRPGILISVDSHIGRPELKREGADSVPWANDGLVDIIFDMNYDESLDMKALRAARSSLDDPAKMVLLVGNFTRSMFRKDSVSPRDSEKVRRLMEISAEFGREGHGSALYDYQWLSDEQIAKLGR